METIFRYTQSLGLKCYDIMKGEADKPKKTVTETVTLWLKKNNNQR